jgi:hypothetical protein
MKKIVMTKYGFVRWPEEDFSDDGNRFTCYRVGESTRVSKLVSDGRAYLSLESSCGKGTLPYEHYSTLPHYHKACQMYNGVSVDSLTDDDLKSFYDACVAYTNEYKHREATIKYPTLEEITEKAKAIKAHRMSELKQLDQLFAEHYTEAAIKFSAYEWKTVQEYIVKLVNEAKRFEPETYSKSILGTAYSFNFIKNPDYLTNSYWFTHIQELFEKKCDLCS